MAKTFMGASLVGISCGDDTIVDRRGQPQQRYVLPRPYADAVAAAGATPILLPYLELARTIELLPHLDAIVISGGDFDIPPEYYQQAPHANLGKLLPERSASERTLVEKAIEHDIPLLGICGGMQLINVVCGGTLFQDAALRPHTQEHQQPHDRAQPHHAVQLAPDTLLKQIWNDEVVHTNSTHHQLIDRVGAELVVAGKAEDGVVEAIVHRHRTFCVGVQWHPEALAREHHAPLFTALLDSAKPEST